MQARSLKPMGLASILIPDADKALVAGNAGHGGGGLDAALGAALTELVT
jgi:hypothetical protein